MQEAMTMNEAFLTALHFQLSKASRHSAEQQWVHLSHNVEADAALHLIQHQLATYADVEACTILEMLLQVGCRLCESMLHKVCRIGSMKISYRPNFCRPNFCRLNLHCSRP